MRKKCFCGGKIKRVRFTYNSYWRWAWRCKACGTVHRIGDMILFKKGAGYDKAK